MSMTISICAVAAQHRHREQEHVGIPYAIVYNNIVMYSWHAQTIVQCEKAQKMSLVQALGFDWNPVVCYNTEHLDTMFRIQLTAVQDSIKL